MFPDIIRLVSKHLGLEVLHQNNIWPNDRWHDRGMVRYIHEQMHIHRRGFITRRWICLSTVAIVTIASTIIGLYSVLTGIALFVIATVSVFNYYQNNISHYFSDPYEYELEVLENSLDVITETEATEYAEIIITRKDIEQLNKRIRAISRNNFLFLNVKKHHDQK